jgi:hypothetical protein
MTSFPAHEATVCVRSSIDATGPGVPETFARAFACTNTRVRGCASRLQSSIVKSIDFGRVRKAAAGLPDVEETTSWGAPALKVRGKMFVCQATNKQAEPNTLVVRMDIAQRDALIEEDPAVYYLKDHYVDYPCVLVRLSRVRPDALRDLVQTAYRFVSPKTPQRRHRNVRTRS